MGKTEELNKAFAYVRTSSLTNVGSDKDSDKRQLHAIQAFATRHNFQIVGTFRDDGISGEDDIPSRPGFAAMLDALEANGTRTVIVEDASRFARKVVVQELGIIALIAREVSCWSAAGDVELTNTEDEFKVMMRQVAGAFAQLEKTRLVKKLRAARDRKRNPVDENGKAFPTVKVEGRKSVHEARSSTVELARKLNRKPVKGNKPSLREISRSLFEAGHHTKQGNAYSPSAISRMLNP